LLADEDAGCVSGAAVPLAHPATAQRAADARQIR
jgi:hypothetical protein